MPRINDYGAPEVESSVPLEVSSQRIEEAGQLGRSVRNFGQGFEDLAQANYQQAAKQEVSNAQVQWSEVRANAQVALDKQIREGKVDVDQLSSDFQDYVDKHQDNYQTQHGRQVFNYQAARTRSMLVRSAAHAQSVLVGQQAAANRQATLDNDSSALFSHPENFSDIYGAHMKGIEADVDSGALPAAMEGKAKHDAGVELAANTIRGWAQLDPNKAQKILDSGAFDKFFNGDKKTALQGYIDARRKAMETANAQSDRTEEKAKKAQANKFMADNFSGVYDGSYTPDKVMAAVQKGTLTAAEGKEQIAAINLAAKDEFKPDTRTYNDLYKRIQLPDDDPNKVKDFSQLMPYYEKLGPSGTDKLKKEIESTPDHKAQNTNRSNLLKMAYSALVKDDPMNGFDDAAGKEHYKQFTEALQTEEAKPGANLGDLYRSSSPSYFGKQVFDFASPMSRKMRGAAAPVVNQQTEAAKVAPRQDGESAADYLKRLGK